MHGMRVVVSRGIPSETLNTTAEDLGLPRRE